MENSKNHTMKFEVSSEYLLKQINELGEVIANSFENSAFKGLESQLKKIGMAFNDAQDQKKLIDLNKSIKQMAKVLKKHAVNKPTNISEFNDTIVQRMNSFIYDIEEVKQYPIKKFEIALEEMLKKENIETTSTKSLFKNLKKTLLNLILNCYIENEEAVFDLLIDEEIKKLRVNYIFANSSLYYLNPHKHKQYVNCLLRALTALYHDIHSFFDFSNPAFKAIEQLFQRLLEKLNTAGGKSNTETDFHKNIENTEDKSLTTNYPAYIFRDINDFRLFNEIMNSKPNAEDIGFVYRIMNEKETPSKIVVTETKFRRWFNEESNFSLELKNPIKTLDKIKSHDKRNTMYNLQKQLILNN